MKKYKKIIKHIIIGILAVVFIIAGLYPSSVMSIINRIIPVLMLVLFTLNIAMGVTKNEKYLYLVIVWVILLLGLPFVLTPFVREVDIKECGVHIAEINKAINMYGFKKINSENDILQAIQSMADKTPQRPDYRTLANNLNHYEITFVDNKAIIIVDRSFNNHCGEKIGAIISPDCLTKYFKEESKEKLIFAEILYFYKFMFRNMVTSIQYICK